MEDKDWIQEKCNTNKPPTEVPKKPSIGNRKKSTVTKAKFYHDILTYIEARLGLIQALQDASETKDHYRRQLYLHIVEQRQQEIDRWLNEEVEVKEK